MCNACGFGCCAWDGFDGCGCDSCSEPKCWTVCDPINNVHGEDCDCPEDDEFGWPDDDPDPSESVVRMLVRAPSSSDESSTP